MVQEGALESISADSLVWLPGCSPWSPVTGWWHQHSLQQQHKAAKQPPPCRGFPGAQTAPNCCCFTPERGIKEGRSSQKGFRTRGAGMVAHRKSRGL